VVFRANLWKKSSPMTSIQDSQREQEHIFFDQIIVNRVKLIKVMKRSPGTADQLSKFLVISCDVRCTVL